MLLTAQRVVSPLANAQGVNVYQYLHGPQTWERVPDEFLPEANPGELVAQWIQLAPGGNRVVSFLDVVVPDETSMIELQQRLTSLKHHLDLSENPTARHVGSLWVRFGCGPLPVKSTTELGALAGHVVLSLSGTAAQVVSSR